MTIQEAFILGIIQGLTEFLPISSSGHLVIGQEVLGISVPGNSFEIIVHLGTLFSVILVFWRDIYELIISLYSSQTRRFIFALIIGTLPAAIVGLFFGDLFRPVYEDINIVAITMMFTGSILLITKFINKKSKDITIGKGLLIGITQALAIFPGISRSGVTISTGMFLGIAPEKAAKYSFLLAIPAIIGAGLVTKLDTSGNETTVIPFWIGSVGFMSALVVGWISLKLLIGLIKTGKFHWFGVYCIIVGLIVWII